MYTNHTVSFSNSRAFCAILLQITFSILFYCDIKPTTAPAAPLELLWGTPRRTVWETILTLSLLFGICTNWKFPQPEVGNHFCRRQIMGITNFLNLWGSSFLRQLSIYLYPLCNYPSWVFINVYVAEWVEISAIIQIQCFSKTYSIFFMFKMFPTKSFLNSNQNVV